MIADLTPPTTGFHHDSVIRSAHFIGVCGAGMKPIARGLLSLGVAVSGSDLDGEKGKDLASLGAKVYSGHKAEHLADADVVVYSTAISDSNPELAKARALQIPIIHRSEMLGWFLAKKESVLVAGTHGKTTTTTMISLLLEAAGFDPWGFVGGLVREFGGNLRLGGDRWAVAEADESDGSFLNLPRHHAIITNIEAEHLNYWGTEEAMFRGFADLVEAMPISGRLVLCMDDPGVQRLAGELERAFVSYSVKGAEADFQATEISLTGTGCEYTIKKHGRRLGRVSIGIPGMQNVANSLGAFAMADALGANVEELLQVLAEFRGVDRRFTKRTAPEGYLVIDDYAHHPTEIRATVEAAKLLAAERGGRLISVFQPHRYTRTQSFFEDFGPALQGSDRVFVMEVYASSEEPIEGVTGASLAEKVRQQLGAPVEFLADMKGLKKIAQTTLKDSDIVLLLGAGSITKLADLLTVPAPC